MKFVLQILFAVLLLIQSSFSQKQTVIVLNIDGAIHPTCADYIHLGLEKAISENAECLIIKLNTPGGLLTSTRKIVTDFLESPIPIIVYVSPAGSQAQSHRGPQYVQVASPFGGERVATSQGARGG